MRQFQLRPLSQPERLTLEEMYRNAKKPRCRQRAHLILLAEKKYPLKTISEIVGICYHSVCHYVQAFNQDGFLALYDAKRSGRKPLLTAAQREQIATWLEFSPRALHYQQGCWTIQLMARRIKAVYQVTLTLERVRQIIHEAGFT